MSNYEKHFIPIERPSAIDASRQLSCKCCFHEFEINIVTELNATFDDQDEVVITCPDCGAKGQIDISGASNRCKNCGPISDVFRQFDDILEELEEEDE